MKAQMKHRPWQRAALFGVVLVVLLGLTWAWSVGPLRDWLDIDRIVGALQRFGARVGVLPAILSLAIASVVAVPLTVLVLISVVAFGPWAGAVYALMGSAIGSALSFLLGRMLGAQVLRHFGGERVNEISQRLGERGILAAIALRLVPIAPFAVINMIAGSSHIRLRDFLIGSTVGMIPLVVFSAVFVDTLIAAVNEPGPMSVVILLGAVLLVAVGAWLARRWVGRG